MTTDQHISNLLQKIEIENYKSFTKETIDFKGVTSIVGANESGKSNLLGAIYHLSRDKQKKPFEPQELRINAPSYPKGTVIITYNLTLTESLLGTHKKDFPNLIGRTITLSKRGIPKQAPEWQSHIEVSQQAIPDIIRINNKTKFKFEFQKTLTSRKAAQSRCDRGWFAKDSTIDLRKLPYSDLLKRNVIDLLSGQQKIDFIKNILKDYFLKNIKIFQWNYQERDFLPENVNIDEFVLNPQSFNL